MKVKETSVKKILEALLHDSKLGDYELAVDVGDAAFSIDDIRIDLARKLISIRPGDNILCFYEDEVEFDDDEGLPLGEEE